MEGDRIRMLNVLGIRKLSGPLEPKKKVDSVPLARDFGESSQSGEFPQKPIRNTRRFPNPVETEAGLALINECVAAVLLQFSLTVQYCCGSNSSTSNSQTQTGRSSSEFLTPWGVQAAVWWSGVGETYYGMMANCQRGGERR